MFDGAFIEEGWRYRKTLGLKISYGDLNHIIPENILQAKHKEMMKATHQLLLQLKSIAVDNESKKSRGYAIFRFTPVVSSSSGDSMEFGTTVHIDVSRNVQSTGMLKECVFFSGFFHIDSPQATRAKLKTHAQGTSSCVLHNAQYDESSPQKEDVFVSLGKSEAETVYIFRNIIDPEYLRDTLKFRYCDNNFSESCLFGSPENKVVESHQKTIKNLKDRGDKLKNEFSKAAEDAEKTDIGALMQRLNKHMEHRREVGNNPDTNSYTCAEQVAIDFMSDIKTIKYLKSMITEKRPEGVIIHLHTSDTPCGSCATSLCRECENGGLFKRIFENIPVQLVCTTVNHYVRPEDAKIPYRHTSSFEFLVERNPPEPLEFNLNQPNPVFPIILFKETVGNDYIIDMGHYDNISLRDKRPIHYVPWLFRGEFQIPDNVPDDLNYAIICKQIHLSGASLNHIIHAQIKEFAGGGYPLQCTIAFLLSDDIPWKILLEGIPHLLPKYIPDKVLTGLRRFGFTDHFEVLFRALLLVEKAIDYTLLLAKQTARGSYGMLDQYLWEHEKIVDITE